MQGDLWATDSPYQEILTTFPTITSTEAHQSTPLSLVDSLMKYSMPSVSIVVSQHKCKL